MSTLPTAPASRLRLSVALLPLTALVAGLLSLYLLEQHEQRFERTATTQAYARTEGVAGILGNYLHGTQTSFLRMMAWFSEDLVTPCQALNSTANTPRVSVYDEAMRLVCGSGAVINNPTDEAWTYAQNEVHLPIYQNGQVVVISIPTERLFEWTVGPDFPARLDLYDSDGTRIDTLDNVPKEYRGQVLRPVRAAIPGTSWSVAMWTFSSGNDHQSVVSGVLACIVLASMLPFALGWRLWTKDAIADCERFSAAGAVLDRHLNTKAASKGIPESFRRRNLLDSVDEADRSAVVALFANWRKNQSTSTIRFRLPGQPTQIDMRIRERSFLTGRFLVVFWVVSTTVQGPDRQGSIGPSSRTDNGLRLVLLESGDADNLGLKPGDSLYDAACPEDRWRVESLRANTLANPGVWDQTTIRTRAGRVLTISLNDPHGGDNTAGDTLFLRTRDDTRGQLAKEFIGVVGGCLADAGTPVGRARMPHHLTDFTRKFLPGAQVRIVGDNRNGVEIRTAGEDTTIDVNVRWQVELLGLLVALLSGQRQQSLGADMTFRRELAVELHDKVMQPLIWARLRSGTDPEIVEQLGGVLTLLRGMVNALRTPPWQLALSEAIDEAARPLKDAGIAVVVDIVLPEPLGPRHEAVLLRGVGESFSNVLRHAKATVVTVSLARHGKTNVLIVTDDGVGPPEQSSSGGMGVETLDEDAGLLDGTFTLTRGPEGGAVARLSLPLESDPPIRTGAQASTSS